MTVTSDDLHFHHLKHLVVIFRLLSMGLVSAEFRQQKPRYISMNSGSLYNQWGDTSGYT